MRLTIMKALTIITIMPQVRVEAIDLIMVRAETDNLEDLYHETGQRPQYSQCQFQNYRYQRSAPQQNRTQYGSACKPYFQGNQMNTYRGRGRGPQQLRGCGCSRQNFHNNAGTDQYQYYTHDQQSEQYGPPCSLCGGFNHSPKHCYKIEHDINNIMEKMSINPHQSQQSNLYQ